MTPGRRRFSRGAGLSANAQVAELTALVQQVTGQTVALASVDQGYTGANPAGAAIAQGIQLEVVKWHDAEGPQARLRLVASVVHPGYPQIAVERNQ